jgi:hypothetical protein
MQATRPRDPPRNRPSALCTRSLLLALTLLGACTGIVVEPDDDQTVTGMTKFWGYSAVPDQEVHLEAQNTQGQWESVAVVTSLDVPTYTGTKTGYYYEISYDPTVIAARFRRPSDGRTLVLFRVKSPDMEVAETRHSERTGSDPSGIESYLERTWEAFQGDGILRIRF